MNSRVVLSIAAVADLDAIDDYTTEHFGRAQAIRTIARFRKVLELLGRMPNAGQLHPETSPAGRDFRYRAVLGSFVIVYEPSGDGIRVARILHGARNLIAELERDAGDED